MLRSFEKPYILDVPGTKGLDEQATVREREIRLSGLCRKIEAPAVELDDD
jgi:hypothetical protein